MVAMMNADDAMIVMAREELAKRVNAYKLAFEAREGNKQSLTLRKALNIPLDSIEEKELSDIGDIILSHENVPEDGRQAVYYAHLAKSLQLIADRFKELAELNMMQLPSDSDGLLTDEQLIDMKEQCDKTFQMIVSFTEDPNATGQSFTIAGNGGKGFKLDIPRFHKAKSVESSKFTYKINGQEFKTPQEACSVAFSLKPSRFMELAKEQGFLSSKVGEKFFFHFDTDSTGNPVEWEVEVIEG